MLKYDLIFSKVSDKEDYMFLLYTLVSCYLIFLIINFKNLLTRVANQFANSEQEWPFSYEWIIAGTIHSITEIIVFLILAIPATIHCILALPSIIKEVYNKSEVQL